MTPTDTEAPAGADTLPPTVAEASAKYDIPLRSLHRAVARGLVPARKVGPIYLVDDKAAELYGEIFKARRALDAYTGRNSSDDDDE